MENIDKLQNRSTFATYLAKSMLWRNRSSFPFFHTQQRNLNRPIKPCF